MARHEFGIIDSTPSENDNFEDYEPEKYNCISIDDEHIEKLMPCFEDIPTYFHRLSWKESGLNYIGITLIPPQSCQKFSGVLQKQHKAVYCELISLFQKAEKENKFVIHYGL